jgi:hypothetical protein
MVAKEKDGLDALLFGDGAELVDFKCFRGDREDVTEADIKEQIHSAFMQKRMDRAVISGTPPRPGVPTINVRKFVADLMAAR